mmetsp:Transcript_4825/g.9000  ORF Transcript_4825/g.9000 Transcript_4825/m.9000 type:complete len:109 (-) Transcript_4825:119-445(-)
MQRRRMVVVVVVERGRRVGRRRTIIDRMGIKNNNLARVAGMRSMSMMYQSMRRGSMMLPNIKACMNDSVPSCTEQNVWYRSRIQNEATEKTLFDAGIAEVDVVMAISH